MDAKKLLGNEPWISKDGCFDPTKFPIDGILMQALDADESKFRSALMFLQSMYGHGRKEAGVFLLGLLVASDDQWERRITIVNALRDVQTQPCADLLFAELRRVKSSNTTRRYLAAVIQSLALMPAELIQEGFTSLANDKSFSQKMRAKFKSVVAKDQHFDDDWF